MAVGVVVVGTSMGGFHALGVVLGGLPRTFGPPLVVVQHRSKSDPSALSKLLQRCSRMRVREAEDKLSLKGGEVFIAPPDYHVLVERGSLALSTEAPLRYARPSIDVLFESAALAYGDEVVCVVLTGANDDGARGASIVKERGGVVIAQDPATAESSAMPAATVAATHADYVLPLSEIPGILVEICALPRR